MFLFCSFIGKKFPLVNCYVGQYAFGIREIKKLKRGMTVNRIPESIQDEVRETESCREPLLGSQ